MDSSTLRFLTVSALEAERKLEEEEEVAKKAKAQAKEEEDWRIEAKDPDGWILDTGSDGVHYYWHRLTHSSVWTLPSRLSEASSGARMEKKTRRTRMTRWRRSS